MMDSLLKVRGEISNSRNIFIPNINGDKKGSLGKKNKFNP